MKTLKQLLAKQQIKQQPIPLFSKLKQLKNNQTIPANVSNTLIQNSQQSQKQPFQQQIIKQIKIKLQKYKHQKALDVLKRHLKTQEPIDHIVDSNKHQYQYEALCLIDERYKRSAERLQKSPNQGGSTLPNSNDKNIDVQTPGFDLPESKYKSSQGSADPRQFTLGQRGGKYSSSNQSTKQYQEGDSMVSEFRVKDRETASQKIKNKIMNPQKTQIDT